MKVTIHTKAESTANLREHWGAKHRRTQPQRRAATLRVKAGLRDLSLPLLVVTLTRTAPRALDDDNLRGALKAFRDGVASALRIDDRSPLVRWEYEQRRGGVGEHAVDVDIVHADAPGELEITPICLGTRGGP